MSHIEAVYRHGAFHPLDPVHLPEDQRVRLSIEPTNKEQPANWLQRIRVLHTSITRRHGYLPDSAPDIAADRLR